MEARYSYPFVLVLRGTKDEYDDLVDHLVGMGSFSINLLVPEASDPSPYQTFLGKILFRKGKSKALITVDDDTLVVVANPEARLCFRDHVKFVAGEISQEVRWSHLHFENYEDHPYIDEESVPLVLEAEYEQP